MIRHLPRGAALKGDEDRLGAVGIVAGFQFPEDCHGQIGIESHAQGAGVATG